MPQLNLNFTDIPIPETCLWEQLDDEQRRIVIETLARLMTNATRTVTSQERPMTDPARSNFHTHNEPLLFTFANPRHPKSNTIESPRLASTVRREKARIIP